MDLNESSNLNYDDDDLYDAELSFDENIHDYIIYNSNLPDDDTINDELNPILNRIEDNFSSIIRNISLRNENDLNEENVNELNRNVDYDTNLPAQHFYLGNNFEDLSGRIVLDENSYVTIPLLKLPGVILVPGQTLPLQFEGDLLFNMVRTIINNDKIFGLVSSYNPENNSKNVYNNVKLDCLGTILEVRSYITEQDNTVLKIKTEGRERFLIKETWLISSSNILMGRVLILPDIDLVNLLHINLGLSNNFGSKYNKKLLPSCTPYPLFIYEMYDPEILIEKIRKHLNQWAAISYKPDDDETISTSQNVYENRTVLESTNSPQLLRNSNTQEENQSQQGQFSTDRPEISISTTRTIVTRIRPVIENSSISSDTDEDSEKSYSSYAPSTPLEFSYWVTENLPLTDYQRLQLLSLNSPIQRLRWQLGFFEKYLCLCCKRCEMKLCNFDDIFSMSIKGPQGTYVNSYGVVHETLTVYKTTNLILQGNNEIKFSWFPGYAWTICNCKVCKIHIGWKFTSINEKNRPKIFWGLSRKNIKPGFMSENGEPDWISI